MEQDIKTKIAFWYYSCGLTQEEIARRLSLTRQKVNAIIGALKEDGIVTVSIRGCERDYPEWEHFLEEHFAYALHWAPCVPGGSAKIWESLSI